MNDSTRAERDAEHPERRPAPTPPKPGPPAPGTGTLRIVTGDEKAPSAGEKRKRKPKRGRRRNRMPEVAIVLVGPMAAGKTSLGKRVARELAVPFVDTDAVFVRKHGAITDFFERHGEEEFRRIEAEIIAEELEKPGLRFVALGGGAVVTDSTRALLARYPVILLMTTQETVLRTANLDRRPLLRDDPTAWGRILEERRPFYEEVADVTFRTDRATKEQLTQRVVQWVRTAGRLARRAQAKRAKE